jgi:hypothetical protein
VYNISYPRIVEILLTLAAMFPAKPKQVYRTTSKPSGSSELKHILNETVLGKGKIANAKVDATKSQEKARAACKSAIEMGITVSSATKKSLQAIVSTLNQAIKWMKGLIESASKVFDEIADRTLTKDDIWVRKVSLTSALISAEVEAKETTRTISEQRDTFAQHVKEVTQTADLAKIAFKAETTAKEKADAWSNIATAAEPQIMKAAEALSASSINRTRSKRAASDAAVEIMEAQYTAITSGEIKNRAEKTMKVWRKAVETTRSTAKVISKAADQMRDTLDALTNANMPKNREKWMSNRDAIKTLVKDIIKVTTLAQYLSKDAVDQIEKLVEIVEHAARSAKKLQTLISSQEKSFGIQF